MNKNNAKLALHFYNDRLSQKRFRDNINLKSNIVIPMENQNQSLLENQGPSLLDTPSNHHTAGLSSSYFKNLSQYIPKRMRCSSSSTKREDFLFWGGGNQRFQGKTAYQSQNVGPTNHFRNPSIYQEITIHNL